MDDDFDYIEIEYQDDSYGGLTGDEGGTTPRQPTSLLTGEPWAVPYVTCGWPEGRRL